jgi:transposase
LRIFVYFKSIAYCCTISSGNTCKAVFRCPTREVGDIRRFAKAGNYASYCRCVKSQKLSDTKKKGEGNRKNGNRYLSWAYVEAANFAVRHSPRAKAFHQRKCAKTKNVVAIKALANKLARASVYILRDQSAFDEKRLHG